MDSMRIFGGQGRLSVQYVPWFEPARGIQSQNVVGGTGAIPSSELPRHSGSVEPSIDREAVNLVNLLAGKNSLTLNLITSLHAECRIENPWDGFTLRGTFMTADVQEQQLPVPVRELYLFLLRPTLRIQDSGHREFIFPPGADSYFWAFDIDGRHRLTINMVESLGLPTPKFSFKLNGLGLDGQDSAFVRYFLAAKGFDPDTQDAAIAMNYPLLSFSSIIPQTRIVELDAAGEKELEEMRMPGSWPTSDT
ncbi:hypothetical protein FB45DRAFT_230278 [Roridomyces roridus]|uniref:Uncharacterized protein n=1 Tax=Roridomyces roridus TaxID=1738132 RepID=A0AAD7FF89_9AGAR|nr:hypothetical protein FB45DRAFT_230278 [Roridomyces roridus]